MRRTRWGKRATLEQVLQNSLTSRCRPVSSFFSGSQSSTAPHSSLTPSGLYSMCEGAGMGIFGALPHVTRGSLSCYFTEQSIEWKNVKKQPYSEEMQTRAKNKQDWFHVHSIWHVYVCDTTTNKSQPIVVACFLSQRRCCTSRACVHQGCHT